MKFKMRRCLKKTGGLFFAGFLFLLVIEIQTLSAFGISNDYSLDSFHTGLAGGNSSNPEYNLDFLLGYQQGGAYAESSDYRVDIGLFSIPVFCGDGICNPGENCSSCAADCGNCPSVPSEEVTTIEGGGVSCTNDWVCSEWYPQPCPQTGIQKRVCVNRGSCTGKEGMPNLTRTCIPEIIEPAEPLFDIFVNIPLQSKWILKGEDVKFDVKLVNVGNKTTIDVAFQYLVINEDNKLIAEKKETRAIGEKDEFKIKLTLPDDLGLGVYRVFVQINYDANKTATAGDSFEVVKDGHTLLMRRIISFLPALSIVVIFLLILIRLLIGRRKGKIKHKEKVRQRRITRLEKRPRIIRKKEKRITKPKIVKYKEKRKIRKPVMRRKTEIIKSASTKQRERKRRLEKKHVKMMLKQVRSYK